MKARSSWTSAVSFVFCVIIATLASRYGEKHITLSDKISFVLALLSIPLWLITHGPLCSVILLAIIDGFGFYPTFRKSYTKPFEEKAFMYNLDIVKYGLSLPAMTHFSLAAIINPIFIIITDAVFVGLLLIRRYQLNRASS